MEALACVHARHRHGGHLTGVSQNPARHSDEQHSALAAHPVPVALQSGVPGGVPVAPSPFGVPPPPGGGGTGASQDPFVQLAAQQSAPVTHEPAPPAGLHAVAHVFDEGSQCLPQHSASVVHVALRPLHAAGGAAQRPSTQRSLLSVRPQQPDCGPEPQLSPVGRQVELATSTTHLSVS